jgi:hypothetical protein
MFAISGYPPTYQYSVDDINQPAYKHPAIQDPTTSIKYSRQEGILSKVASDSHVSVLSKKSDSDSESGSFKSENNLEFINGGSPVFTQILASSSDEHLEQAGHKSRLIQEPGWHQEAGSLKPKPYSDTRSGSKED